MDRMSYAWNMSIRRKGTGKPGEPQKIAVKRAFGVPAGRRFAPGRAPQKQSTAVYHITAPAGGKSEIESVLREKFGINVDVEEVGHTSDAVQIGHTRNKVSIREAPSPDEMTALEADNIQHEFAAPRRRRGWE